MVQSSKPTVDGLLNFYTKVVNSLGLVAGENGLLSLQLDEDNKVPVSINDKRLALPTQTVLKEANWDQIVAFHPLAEKINRGESEVIKKTRHLINFRLSVVLSELVTQLTYIAADKNYHEKLSPQQQQLLEVLPKANAKTFESYRKIIEASSIKGKRRLVNVYLKHGGKYHGKDCARVAVGHFPVRDEFDNDDKTIFGVKLASKKDMKGFADLFEYLLPDSGEVDAYSYGSTSMEAPYFDALMHAYIKIAKQLNKIAHLFRKHLEDADALKTDVAAFEDELKDLSFYHDLIPTLAGNDGAVGVEEQEQAQHQTQESAPAPAPEPRPTGSQALGRMAKEIENSQSTGMTAPPPEPTMAPAPTPMTAPSPEPTQASAGQHDESKSLSWSEVRERRRAQEMQQNQPAPYPSGFGWQQPPQPPAGPPAGFAGSTFSGQTGGGMVPPGTYANHPRAYQQNPQMAWQQPPQPMGGGNQPPWNPTGPNVVYPGGI